MEAFKEYITKEEFEEKYFAGMTPNNMGDIRLMFEAQACDCGESYCQGWQMRVRDSYMQKLLARVR